MNEFAEKNEPFLRLCCKITRFFGLFIAFVAFILIPISLLGIFWDNVFNIKFQNFIMLIPLVISGLVFPAFLLLGIEQLIKCLIDFDFKPNWILRFGDKIIYIYVGFLFINFIYKSMWAHKMFSFDEIVLQILVPSAISTFIKILIWTGTGLFVKRIIPIIEEHKSLV